MIWQQRLQEFHNYLLLERSMSEHTIEAYLRDVGKVAQYLELKDLDISPTEIERQHLEDFLQYLNDLELDASTQARILSGIKAFYKYLLVEDFVDNDPTALLEGPRLNRKIPAVLTYDEIQRMLAAIDLSTDHGVRNRAMLEALYACGLRVSELINLKLSNLFLDIGFVKVVGKNNKERIVPIGEDAIKHINLYLEGVRRSQLNIKKEDENALFLNRRGRRLSRVMVFNIVKEVAELAGIPKNVSPHTFRHSFATHLVEGGADLKAVQDMLGHESIITTEIYTHMDTEYLKETILLYHPRNRGGGRRAEG